MKKSLLGAVLVLVALAIFVATFPTTESVEASQTPDGETPANEGVCDELIGATPGLYGLCVAFCEAQDCEPDFSLADPFETCTPSSEKVLENYDRRKQEGDIDMPCIKAPCPCWSPDELLDLVMPIQIIVEICDSAAGSDIWFQFDPIFNQNALLATVQDEGFLCGFQDIDSLAGKSINRFLNIDEAELGICRADVIRTGMERGFTCWD